MPSGNDNLERMPQEILDTAITLWRHSADRHSLPIEGNSMLPLIRDGDCVAIESGVDQVRRGQIIVFLQGDGLVAHRFLSKVPGKGKMMFLTKGDNISRLDPMVPEEEVVGRVVAIRRGSKIMSLDTLAWQVAGLAIATVLLMWSRLMARFGHLLGSSKARRTSQVIGVGNRLMRAVIYCALMVSQRLCSRWRFIEPHQSPR